MVVPICLLAKKCYHLRFLTRRDVFLIKFEYLFILKALPENFDHFGVSNQNLSSYAVYNKALPEIVDNFGIFYHYLSFEFK